MCYVGKATKIFIGVVAALLVVGLVLGLVVFRHGLQREPHACDGSGICGAGNRPGYPEPIPIPAAPSTAASSPPPPYSGTPNVSTTAAPPPISSSSPPSPPSNPPLNPPPPAVEGPPTTGTISAPPPVLSPPSPEASAQGPGPFLGHNRSSSL